MSITFTYVYTNLVGCLLHIRQDIEYFIYFVLTLPARELLPLLPTLVLKNLRLRWIKNLARLTK